MVRLTIRNSDGSVSQPVDLRLADALERLAAYEDTGLSPEEIKELCTDEVAEIARMFRKMIHSGEIDHLIDLLKAEQEGRLVVLQCKVGDTVYVVERGEILEETVIGYSIFKKNDGKVAIGMTTTYRQSLTRPDISTFGTLMPDDRLSFFASRAEAVKAIEVSGDA